MSGSAWSDGRVTSSMGPADIAGADDSRSPAFHDSSGSHGRHRRASVSRRFPVLVRRDCRIAIPRVGSFRHGAVAGEAATIAASMPPRCAG